MDVHVLTLNGRYPVIVNATNIDYEEIQDLDTSTNETELDLDDFVPYLYLIQSSTQTLGTWDIIDQAINQIIIDGTKLLNLTQQKYDEAKSKKKEDKIDGLYGFFMFSVNIYF